MEALPLEEILQKIGEEFSGWQQDDNAGQAGKSWCFNCLEQAEYWMDTHFWIFEYGRDTDTQREHQILQFCCHNMSEEQIKIISDCMEGFQCSLHMREEE